MLDYNRIANRAKRIYGYLYNHADDIPEESIAEMCTVIELGDEIMRKTPEILKEVITIRQDSFSSDREVLSYLFALLTYCMDEKAMELVIRRLLDMR